LAFRNYFSTDESLGQAAFRSAKLPRVAVPADDKWYTRIVIANIVVRELEKLDLNYPVLSGQQEKDLAASKKILTGEMDSPAEEKQ